MPRNRDLATDTGLPAEPSFDRDEAYLFVNEARALAMGIQAVLETNGVAGFSNPVYQLSDMLLSRLNDLAARVSP